ncbi:phosphatidylserine synthase, partial [Rhodobacteraceae bacterium R_SAG2]|nr:phosphatidylserine synthase [Rhodobacteraceae bacterium R_SAG2]
MERRDTTADAPDREDMFEVLVTAQEAWPAFERAVLGAETVVRASFRIFDFATFLHSDEAKELGTTWADLVEHILRKGVDFDLVVSDFDALMAEDLHGKSQATLKQARDIQAKLRADPPTKCGKLTVRAALHPARAGLVPRLAFGPFVKRRKKKVIRGRKSRDQSSWLPELSPVTHHQKLAVIDGTTLYVGGLDLNNRRYDTPDHDQVAEQTWADVQLILKGPEAAEADAYLQEFETLVAGKETPKEGIHLRRTLSAPRKLGFWAVSPQTVAREIEEDFLNAFERARHMIYMETQFLRSSVLANGLAEAAQRNPDLSVILV